MDSHASTGADVVRGEFVAALLAGDANLAEIVAVEAVESGMSVADLYVDVIAPALEQIGHRWATGEMTIADEHLATGIAHDVMGLVSRTATAFPRRSRERILLAAIGGEGHITGLRMIGDLAESRGFDVRYLGAALPIETIAGIVAKHTPDLIGLSVTMAGHGARLAGALDEIAESGHVPRAILVGGHAVPEPLKTDPRVRYAEDAREAIALIEELADPV